MSRLFFAACLLGLLPLACTAENSGAPENASSTGESAPAHTAKITYSSCHVDGPYIALTFDDGPHAANTPRLLEMLKQRGIKATFFMVGECAAEYPQIVKRIAAEGHEVANHSWSHPQLSRMSDEAVREQLRKTHDAIVNGCGVTPKLMRPPYGALNEKQRKWVNSEFGYKVILWDVDPLDWKVRNSAHVESEILKQTHAGSIILSHDIHKTTIDAMPATIDALLAKGYKFVTVSQLLAMDRPVAPKQKGPAAPSVTKENETPKNEGPNTTAPATTTTEAKPAPVAESKSVQ